eukprot:3780234-Pleurochrysis_carterae.AAC.1
MEEILAAASRSSVQILTDSRASLFHARSEEDRYFCQPSQHDVTAVQDTELSCTPCDVGTSSGQPDFIELHECGRQIQMVHAGASHGDATLLKTSFESFPQHSPQKGRNNPSPATSSRAGQEDMHACRSRCHGRSCETTLSSALDGSSVSVGSAGSGRVRERRKPPLPAFKLADALR